MNSSSIGNHADLWARLIHPGVALHLPFTKPVGTGSVGWIAAVRAPPRLAEVCNTVPKPVDIKVLTAGSLRTKLWISMRTPTATQFVLLRRAHTATRGRNMKRVACSF